MGTTDKACAKKRINQYCLRTCVSHWRFDGVVWFKRISQ